MTEHHRRDVKTKDGHKIQIDILANDGEASIIVNGIIMGAIPISLPADSPAVIYDVVMNPNRRAVKQALHHTNLYPVGVYPEGSLFLICSTEIDDNKIRLAFMPRCPSASLPKTDFLGLGIHTSVFSHRRETNNDSEDIFEGRMREM